MQMQPIPHLGPLVAGAQDTQTNSGENFLDSLQSAQSMSDTVSGEQSDRIATAQQDDEYATAPAPKTDETTTTPEQPAQESDVHIECAAIVEQSSANDEKLAVADKKFTNALVGSATTVHRLLSQTIIGEVVQDQFLPRPPHKDSETTLLQAYFKPPHSPASADSLPGRIITNVAYDPYVNDRKAGGPIDLRYVELVQNSETGYPAQSTKQSGGATIQADYRFAEILGLTPAPGPETVQWFVQQRQRIWGTGFDATAADPAGHKNEARMAQVKISNQFMNGLSTNSSGHDVLWTNPAENIAASSPTQGFGESADLFHCTAQSQSTTLPHVLSQDGVTARPLAELGNRVENRIIDQVIQQVSIRSSQQQSSISIKLHPEELGHLRMELVANHETIKAHILVQNQQAQDIVEKNLTRLREGFEQQGLVLEEIQVSVNSESKSGPGFFNNQHTLHARPQTTNPTRTQVSDVINSEKTLFAPHRSESIISLRI